MLKKLFTGQEGNVLILVALLALVFMGIAAVVIDVGMMYSERAKLVSAVDAAAISGAWKLPDEGRAISSANTYLNKNVNDTGNIRTREIRVLNHVTYGKVVSVKAVKSIDLFFARIIGYLRTDISASAKATKIIGKNSLIPIGITSDNWNKIKSNPANTGRSITLKVISKDNDSGFDRERGNFYALSLGGNGANNYRNNLGNGYSGNLGVGSKIDTETGNMVGPTDEGLANRLKDNKGEKACTIDENLEVTHRCGLDDDYCPRMAYVPIFQLPPGGLKGKTQVTILGFAKIFLTDPGNSGEVSGIFLSWSMVEHVAGVVDPSNVRLIE